MDSLIELIGSESRFTIFDQDGHIIVKEGEIITYGVVWAARDAGKLDDLRIAAEESCEEQDLQPAFKWGEMSQEEREQSQME